MENAIKKFISGLWVLIMFNPLIAATMGVLEVSPKTLFGLILLSMAFFGMLGSFYLWIYNVTKKYSDQKWERSDF